MCKLFKIILLKSSLFPPQVLKGHCNFGRNVGSVMLGTQWKGCVKMPENCYLQTIDVVEHNGTFQEAAENHVLWLI